MRAIMAPFTLILGKAAEARAKSCEKSAPAREN